MEEFRAVKDYPDYEVSNLGRVKSLKQGKEVILKNGIDSGGYRNVSLYFNGKKITQKVHKLVAIEFLSHVPCGYDLVVDHKNSDKLNCELSNLQVITNRANLSKDKIGSSKYTGVSLKKCSNRWQCNIRVNSMNVYLGMFSCELSASIMYQKALTNIDKYNGNPNDFRNLLNNL